MYQTNVPTAKVAILPGATGRALRTTKPSGGSQPANERRRSANGPPNPEDYACGMRVSTAAPNSVSSAKSPT